VVISGASTGIGRATALHLRGLDFEVLAGVRGQAVLAALPVAVTDRLPRLALRI
jgi:NADP-dependent 3-hydroxy acid dehydrogenase YdfG